MSIWFSEENNVLVLRTGFGLCTTEFDGEKKYMRISGNLFHSEGDLEQFGFSYIGEV